MSNDDLILRGSVLERLELVEHDDDGRDCRSGASELARIRKYIEALPADDRVAKMVDAANQARLAFAGFVSVRSAVDKLDAALAAWGAGK
jgi:hypothetical protein